MTNVEAFDLASYLDTEIPQVERAIERAIERIEPSLPTEIASGVRHAVTTGGKRLRPILCATAYRACGGAAAADPLYDLAVSLELIHAYSLVHDDLPCMDDAELRRGVSTTHREHGEDTAMVSGAVLIPGAALQAIRAARALGCSQGAASRVTHTLLEASGAGGMVGGQWLDLLAEGEALDAAALDRLHRHKTGALLTAALVMGSLAAEAEPFVTSRLEEYGRAIGLAFQITDDVLDVTTSSEVLGKNPSDIVLDKSTYVSLYGLEAARRRADDLVAEALEALRQARIDAPALTALAHYVVSRKH
ncbi:MAG: polyprenyl synthetase family protein [Gemmatimonadota bacterium]|nr:polyprenyl synthetase family protein [Gemmatimonadota bacterium]